MIELGFIVALEVGGFVLALTLARTLAIREPGASVYRVVSALERAVRSFLGRQRSAIASAGLLALAAVIAAYALLGRVELALLVAAGLVVGASSCAVSAALSAALTGRAAGSTHAAARFSFNAALATTLRAGGAVGIGTETASTLGALAVFGVTYLAEGGRVTNAESAPGLAHASLVVTGYALGAALTALVTQRAGSAYEVGAESGRGRAMFDANGDANDPRNPALVAGLVGDHAGTVAAGSATLFALSATATAAVFSYARGLGASPGDELHAAALPLVVRSFGMVGCAAGTLAARADEAQSQGLALLRGLACAVAITLFGIVGGSYWLAPEHWSFLAAAGALGLVAAALPSSVALSFVDRHARPVREAVEALRDGASAAFGSSIGHALPRAFAPVVGLIVLAIAAGALGERAMPSGGAQVGASVFALSLLSLAPYALTALSINAVARSARSTTALSKLDTESEWRLQRLDDVGFAAAAPGRALLLTACTVAPLAALGGVLVSAGSLGLGRPAALGCATLGVLVVLTQAGQSARAASRAAEEVALEVRRQLGGAEAGGQGYTPSYRACEELAQKAASAGLVFGALWAIAPLVLLGIGLGIVYRVGGSRLAAAALSTFVATAAVTALGAALAVEGARTVHGGARRLARLERETAGRAAPVPEERPRQHLGHRSWASRLLAGALGRELRTRSLGSPPHLMSAISDALSTLSDRGLRRLLGARTFLRGLDYEKRRVVEDVNVNDATAHGRVKGSDPDPYTVTIRLGGEGITSHCTCPAFQKTGQHCKHVAALLITVRNRARAALPRPITPPGGHPHQHQHNHQHQHQNAQQLGDGSKASRRRDRRRRVQGQGQQLPAPQSHYTPPLPDASARPTGIGAWLAPEGAVRTLRLEFRVHVRQGGLTVTVLDVDNRVPLLPSVALGWQALSPSGDRAALRVLSRFESGNPRHPAVDVRGEDAAELLPLLRERRVLLEPALMQLRFVDEPLKPRFDLELVGAETIVSKVTFERTTDGRRFQLTGGGWFEGAPGWHVDTSEGVARPLDVRVSPAALRRLVRSPTIAEPASELVTMITYGLPKVATEIGAPLPDLSQVADVVDIEPTFRMRAGGALTEVEVTLTATYGDLEVEVRADGLSPPIMILPPREGQKRARCVRCDIVAQQAAVEKLLDLGLEPSESGQHFVAHGDDSIQFWSEGVGSLPEEWDLYVPEELVGTQVRTKPVAMNARVSSGVDWLSVKVMYESEGVGVERDELERCLREGKKYVRLSDNSFAPIDAERVKALLDREVELIVAAGKTGKIPLSQAGRVQELLEHAANSMIAPAARELFEKLASIDEIKAVKKPKGLKATLRPYQEQGLSWLRFIHEISSGGVLADDMGLGKTLETIALLLSLKNDAKDEALRALIVAPTSVVTNWVREIERFAPALTTALWHGAGRRDSADELEHSNVIITSYALLRRDIDLLKKLRLDYAILDEAQAIKNPLSATAQAAKELAATRRLALTGTPIENRLSEIWSIFDFVSPGLLGPLPKFEERYARPIEQGNSERAARLRSIIHPFILRRTKTEVAKDLPPKLEVDKIIDMAPDQKAIYLQVLREVRAQVMGEVEKVGLAKSHIHILAGLTKLRQAACDPRLLGLPREFSHDDSGKLAAMRELVEEAEAGGHKVLVFSQFVSMLKLIRSALDEDKIRYEYLDGSTMDRPERIDRFQTDPTIPVFLISLKAGGTGLNLTAADTVIHFDPWWNPAVEDQASDRAHRIGQKKVVTVYRLVAASTIEEKILQLKQRKKDLVNSVLSEDQTGEKQLTREDLDDLFRTD